MVLRITTWNVNGIRNPFGYQPWRDKRSFEAMFDILEADIVIMQETKIQRKDLRDDMVLVPGWDCYFSLPKYKKGYSGVAIYTRQSVCSPIRAEEGITGILQPPNSSVSYRDLPEDQQIGGYPTPSQLSQSVVDAATLDSEGRCVILEFPAFVLLGVYSPANRDESRDDFRLGFLDVLDARIRNLAAAGKRVILTGDLNISREEIDSANAEESMRKNGLSGYEFVSTPSRRLFNQLLVDGKVFGEKDEGREEPVLWDICRGFHPGRKGMFTCWEQKINARPGNFGSRIDYVLCSKEMRDWFCDSNIQEGLLGSDHCPVYATIRDRVPWGDGEVDIRDIMNPPNIYRDGERLRKYFTKDLLPLSAKLIPEFDRRRNIRDMFQKKPSLSVTPTKSASVDTRSLKAENGNCVNGSGVASNENVATLPTSFEPTPTRSQTSVASAETIKPDKAPKSTSLSNKRSNGEASSLRPFKRTKSGSMTSPATGPGKAQQSLKSFLKPKTPAQTLDENTVNPQPTKPPITAAPTGSASDECIAEESNSTQQASPSIPFNTPTTSDAEGTITFNDRNPDSEETKNSTTTPSHPPLPHTSPKMHQTNKTSQEPWPSETQLASSSEPFIDPIASKESWTKLFSKRPPPRCEGHNEPCVILTTKKSGMNCGRAFWLCSRPLGPSGTKERGTQWRCPTFIWSSDWNGPATGVDDGGD